MDNLDKFLKNGGRLVVKPGVDGYVGRAVVNIESDKGVAATFPLDKNGAVISCLREAINDTLDSITAFTHQKELLK